MKVGGKRGAANVIPKVERVVSREGVDAHSRLSFWAGHRRELPQRDPGPNTRRKTNLAYFIIIIVSSFITPEGSKISHKNTKIYKITHTKYITKLHTSTHIHTVKQLKKH